MAKFLAKALEIFNSAGKLCYHLLLTCKCAQPCSEF